MSNNVCVCVYACEAHEVTSSPLKPTLWCVSVVSACLCAEVCVCECWLNAMAALYCRLPAVMHRLQNEL